MRKKCVLWAKPVLVTLAIVIAAGLRWPDGSLSAQSTDPLTLPRLNFTDLTYQGGFRMPRNILGNDSFSYGGQHLAFNPARNSLFGSSLHDNVAEVSIPTPVNTNDVNQMPFATYLQGFSDPSEGHFREVEAGGPNPAVLAGLLVDGNRLYATGSIYYDAQNSQVVSHFSHSTNLSETSYSGWSQVWETGKSGYVGGYMANVPSEWRSLLGGPALTGQCCIPIVGRTSYGPAAFGFDPSRIGNNTAVPASPLLYYTSDHTTLGPWEGANAMYGGTTGMGGVAVIAGTRTALFVGRNGLGTYCYGYGVSDPALGGSRASDGQMNCYDPASSDKGMHAYPYRYQIWAYDLADFAAVKAGTKQPWSVVPYAVWPFDLPTPGRTARIGGVTYDAQRQLLYIAQHRADTDGYSERPIIHVLKVNIPSSAVPPPLPTTVSLTPDAAAPQVPGTVIHWSAAATGDKAPYQYKWLSYANGAWSTLRDWSASQTLDWQPTVAATDARMVVWVRPDPATRPADEITADSNFPTAEYPFAIVDAASSAPAPADASAPVSSLALTTNLPAPQPAASTIVWTATATGGSGAYVYKWFVSNDGASWSAIGSWTSSNQFAWTPAFANPNYRVSAWVKSAANPRDEWEATAERPFAIGEVAATSSPVASVALTSNVAAPQPLNTTIVWTATPSGGTGSLLYKWFVFDGMSWTPVGSWTASNQFTWTPAIANPNYRVSAWVKRASTTADEKEASAERVFAITEAPSTPPASLALTADLASPQAVGSTIVWTATATGGTGAMLYKWFVSSDGASWTTNGLWTASNQFTWTPALVNANYRVSAWVKRASTAGDEREASAERPFSITAPSFPVQSVALSTDLPAPQERGTSIVWTAAATGGTGPLVYQWFVTADGTSWNAIGSWTSSNQFTWTPDVAASGYRVSVWAKRASNSANVAEAAADQAFEIQEPITGVTLTTNVPSPQPLSATIEWTATPAGGTGALLFKWFVSSDDGVTWTAAGPWVASNRMNWTPNAVSPKYRVTVWVKHATNPSDYPEASAQRRFAIKK